MHFFYVLWHNTFSSLMFICTAFLSLSQQLIIILQHYPYLTFVFNYNSVGEFKTIMQQLRLWLLMNSVALKAQRCSRTLCADTNRYHWWVCALSFLLLVLFHCTQREICEAKCITTNHFALLTRLDTAARESLAKHTWLQLGAATFGLGPPLGGSLNMI